MINIPVPATVTDALISMVLFFYGLPFIATGLIGLGKGDMQGAGSIFTITGIINGIIGFILIVAWGLTNPVFFSIGFLIMIFALTWSAAGFIFAYGQDLRGLGNASILCGLMMLAFAAFFVLNRDIFSTIGWVWLTVNVLSWTWAFWSITLVSHEKVGLPVVGWTFTIQTFYTLWIPAALLLVDAFSLLPS